MSAPEKSFKNIEQLLNTFIERFDRFEERFVKIEEKLEISNSPGTPPQSVLDFGDKSQNTSVELQSMNQTHAHLERDMVNVLNNGIFQISYPLCIYICTFIQGE